MAGIWGHPESGDLGVEVGQGQAKANNEVRMPSN